MSRGQYSQSNISLVSAERAGGRSILGRIGRDGEIHSRGSAVKDLNEVIEVSRAAITTTTIDLTNDQLGSVVVDDCADALRIGNR